MASAISQSSVGTVVEDLVSDRNIPLKICMIVLNCLQIISSWIAVLFFISHIQEWLAIEVGVSGGFLIFGNYIVAGICNGVIYWRRWNRSTKAYRRRMEEENKQAWVCLRISLSLLGIPTVGRYIETIMVSRKLEELEKKHLHESVNTHREGSQLNPVGTSKLGSIINQKNYQKMSRQGSNPTMTSGISQLSINGMNETNQEKVRRARRQYKRCEHDGALMALIAGATGAGPFTVALAVLYLQRIEKIPLSTQQSAVIIASAILNILWLSATLTHFYPARHVQSEAEFERGVRSSQIGSIILLYFSHLVQVVLRIICFAIFANWFYAYVLIIVCFHWLVGIIIQLAYHIYIKNKTIGQPMVSCGAFLSAMFYAYVGIFDFVNGNQGKTRLRYLIYYAFYYVENICMLVIWIILNPKTQIQFPIPFVCSVLALFWLGFFMLQIYLYYFSYSPYGSSIFGCGKDKNRRKSVNYVEEVRDPVFGVPLAQSAVPLWQNQQSHPPNVANSRISGMSNQNSKFSKPINLDTRHTPSIMSIPSAKTPPSILSQTPSNMKNEKPRYNPTIKPPPVIEHKSRKEIAKPISKHNDSSSSSDDEGLQKYNPKPVRISPTHTNLSHSTSSDLSLPITRSQIINSPNNNDEVKPQPAKMLTSIPLASKSVDNLPYIIPTMGSNMHTKPIGMPNQPPKRSQHQKHRSTERPRNPHQQNRHHNYLHPNTIRNIR